MPKKRYAQRPLEYYFKGNEDARFKQARFTESLLYERRSVVQAYAEFEPIGQNEYLHRARGELSENEIPRCSCEAQDVWQATCQAQCENRSMQVECIRGACASGRMCSNQQFQGSECARLLLMRSEGKGIALAAEQTILKGEFIIQYTGEVIPSAEYRIREKGLVGARHYYGVAISPREVIDARSKGTLARFANHSCSPNSELQRWEVSGETCCGLFALEDIACGKEVTFQYDRVVLGRPPKRCVCGSEGCIGLMP